MALSGLHVVCAFAGRQNDAGRATQPILSFPQWSETLAAAGSTGQAAAVDGSVFHVRCGVDAYIAVGKSPDASKPVSTDTNSARIHIAATDPPLDLYVKAGDKLAWITA